MSRACSSKRLLIWRRRAEVVAAGVFRMARDYRLACERDVPFYTAVRRPLWFATIRRDLVSNDVNGVQSIKQLWRERASGNPIKNRHRGPRHEPCAPYFRACSRKLL